MLWPNPLLGPSGQLDLVRCRNHQLGPLLQTFHSLARSRVQNTFNRRKVEHICLTYVLVIWGNSKRVWLQGHGQSCGPHSHQLSPESS